ncbi:hypothetical protein BD289DRAFT_498942 [Coniella lustricola]|uniref:Uncharacterized protein n=1 Tax=Coniella lustricola TaxID=2025994 RepID=A0A2T3A9Z0_9PEZI|nr:hypothetical protein BD289DRAFT_498942 [Coniella lustricola]
MARLADAVLTRSAAKGRANRRSWEGDFGGGSSLSDIQTPGSPCSEGRRNSLWFVCQDFSAVNTPRNAHHTKRELASTDWLGMHSFRGERARECMWKAACCEICTGHPAIRNCELRIDASPASKQLRHTECRRGRAGGLVSGFWWAGGGTLLRRARAPEDPQGKSGCGRVWQGLARG